MTTRIPITKENGNNNASAGIGAGSTPAGGVGLEERQKKIWRDMEDDMNRRRREWEEEIDKMRQQFFLLRPDADALGIKDDGDLLSGGGSGGGLQDTAAQGSRNQDSAPTPPTSMAESAASQGDRRMGSSGGGPPYHHHSSRMVETNSSSSSASGGGGGGGGGGVAVADDWETMVTKDEQGNPVFRVVFDVREYRPEEVSVRMDSGKVWVSARQQAEGGGSSLSRQYSREVGLPSQLDPLALQCLMGADGTLTVEAPLPAATYAALKQATTFPPPPIKTGSVPGPTAAATPAAITTTSSGTPLQQSFSSSTSSSYQQTSFNPLEEGPDLDPYRRPPPQQHKGVGSGLPPSDPVLPPYQPPAASAQPDPSFPPFQQRPDLVLSSGFPPQQKCQRVVADDVVVPRFTPSSSSSSSVSSLQHQHQQPQKMSSAFSSTSSQQQQQSYHDNSSPELSGFSLPSPPFQSLSHQHTTSAGHAGAGHSLGSASVNGMVAAAGNGTTLSSPEAGEGDSSPDPSTFKLEVDIEDFKPEELTVKTQDRRVVVCARREEKAGNRTSSREMSREHTLPDSVDPLTIKAFFTDGGRLIIEAPFMEETAPPTGLLAHPPMSGR